MIQRSGLRVGVLSALILAGGPAGWAAGPGDDARDPLSLAPIILFRDAKRYTTFPDVKRLPGGRLLCVFRGASFPERIQHIESDARVVGALSWDHGQRLD